MSGPQAVLRDMQPQHEFLVGIDSDGCAFDTMEIKHKECFCPNIIAHWDLQAISKYAREAVEFVNLYSKWRGSNRWPALVKVFDLLRERPKVKARGVPIPRVPGIRRWIEEETALSDDALAERLNQTDDAELRRALEWSQAVNRAIADMVHGVPPFPWMRESLQKLDGRADIMVVSGAPREAVRREWHEHEIIGYACAIAGQEQGNKSEQIELAAGGKYEPVRVLIVGDAAWDLQAAKEHGALFFPILPGREEESWQRLHDEGIGKFISGTYAGSYEQELILEFDACLPETPPWRE